MLEECRESEFLASNELIESEKVIISIIEINCANEHGSTDLDNGNMSNSSLDNIVAYEEIIDAKIERAPADESEDVRVVTSSYDMHRHA